MGKWYGKIGFSEPTETEPGVYTDSITERPYYGEIMQNTRRMQNSGGVNDNINISNKISVLADPYANRNFHTMVYAEFMNTKWKIESIEVQYPRLVLTIGGIWNE